MCNAPATGDEHVPPQCLFPEKKDIPGLNLRKNLISVSACDTHNSKKSKDDEYLLFVLVTHFDNNPIAFHHFASKSLRAITRRPSLISIYENETKDIVLNGQMTSAFKINRTRIDRELDHIARGLYFHEFERPWTKRINIHSPVMFALNRADADSISRIIQNMASFASMLFNRTPKKGDNPEVFWYQLYTAPDKNSLVVKMCFYQGVEVIALSNLKLEENAK